MNIKISKETLMDLVNSVAFPIDVLILNDERVSHFLEDKEKRSKHSISIAKLAIAVVTQEASVAIQLLKNAAKAHNELSFDKEILREYLNLFFMLLFKWIKQHYPQALKEYEERLEYFEKIFMDAYEPFLELEDDEGFFDFDSEDVDNVVNEMHYSDEKKITAEEFMQEDTVDTDMMHDIEDYLEEYDDLIGINDEFSKDDLAVAQRCIDAFVNIFNLSYEFKNIAYSLESLNLFLDNFDTSNKEKMNMLKIFLDTIMDDLKKFKKEVLEDATANDIHYLDASLLANIAQIEISLR